MLITHTALITGSSRGIGKSIALEMARNGYNIILNSSKNVESIAELVEIIQNLGVNCEYFSGDVGNSEFVNAMVSEVSKKYGSIDVLINNAGISYIGLLQDMTDDEWNRIVSTNLTGVFNCCRAVIPGMVRNKSGRIINISSMWGNSGASCEVAYSATKGGINSLTKALAKELAPSGIAVNAIACGVINTDMNSFLSKEEKVQLADDIPIGRFAEPEEVALLASSLISQSKYLTGQIITIDGGYL